MRVLILYCLSIFLTPSAPPEEVNYKKVFGADYSWAVNWLKQNDSLITACSGQFDVPAKQLKAIVFPELVRYNKVFDAIEIESLKYLYVTEGTPYANFSVGYFQMKPSFAELVEKDWQAFVPHDAKLLLFEPSGQNESARRDRLRRLTNPVQQIYYLCAFYKICEKKFASVHFASPATKMKFFATCYNAGYHHSYDHLVAMQGRKHFLQYNYSDICLYYFEKE